MTFDKKAFASRLSEFNSGYCADVPSMELSRFFMDNLIHALFPIRQNCAVDEGEIAIELDRTAVKLRELLNSIRKSLDRSPDELVEDFFSKVPEAFEQLAMDAADLLARPGAGTHRASAIRPNSATFSKLDRARFGRFLIAKEHQAQSRL